MIEGFISGFTMVSWTQALGLSTKIALSGVLVWVGFFTFMIIVAIIIKVLKGKQS